MLYSEAFRVKANSIIGNGEEQLFHPAVQLNAQMRGVRVAGNIRQRFLGNPETFRFKFQRQTPALLETAKNLGSYSSALTITIEYQRSADARPRSSSNDGRNSSDRSRMRRAPHRR